MIPHLFLDTHWYWYSADFHSPFAAKYSWEELDRVYAGKGLDLGVYRHGTTEKPGQRITVLSHRPEGVLRARRDLRKLSGRDVPLDDLGPSVLEALIARRIRFVHEAQEREPGTTGHATIRREAPGEPLHQDGTFDE